jgi:hypothetical protein
MTMPDLGPDRLRHASDTRQLASRARTESGAHVSARAFWTAFAVILLAIGLFALILWQT